MITVGAGKAPCPEGVVMDTLTYGERRNEARVFACMFANEKGMCWKTKDPYAASKIKEAYF